MDGFDPFSLKLRFNYIHTPNLEELQGKVEEERKVQRK